MSDPQPIFYGESILVPAMKDWLQWKILDNAQRELMCRYLLPEPDSLNENRILAEQIAIEFRKMIGVK